MKSQQIYARRGEGGGSDPAYSSPGLIHKQWHCSAYSSYLYAPLIYALNLKKKRAAGFESWA